MITKQYEPEFARIREWAWAHPLTGDERESRYSLDVNRFAILDGGAIRIALSLNR